MRVKCSVCGLFRGAKPHSGPLHDAIMANRRRVAKGLLPTGKRRGVRRRRKG